MKPPQAIKPPTANNTPPQIRAAIDADLETLSACWPILPANVRAAILGLAEAISRRLPLNAAPRSHREEKE